MSVIIVTFNSSAVIEQCLTALRPYNNLEIILVDNCSIDKTVQLVKNHDAPVRIVENSVNAGFSVAVNQGSSLATGESYLLLNPDAEILGSDINLLSNSLLGTENAAIMSPFVVEADGAFTTIGAGRQPTIWRMFTHATGLSRLGRRIPFLQGYYLLKDQVSRGQTYEVEWVSGGCLLIRADVWNELGGLTERWFMYAEDIELCLNARSHEYSVFLNTAIEGRHEVGKSASTIDGRINTVWIENLYDLYKWKYARTPVQSWLWKSTVVFGFRLRSAVLSLKMRLRRSDQEHLKQEQRRFQIYAKALARQTVRLP